MLTAFHGIRPMTAFIKSMIYPWYNRAENYIKYYIYNSLNRVTCLANVKIPIFEVGYRRVDAKCQDRLAKVVLV